MAADVPVLPPKEAIDFFRRKGFTFGFAWQDVWQDEHVRAFTVAKAMSRDLLEDIRGAVDKAIAEGTTLDQFRSDLRPLLEAKGWWGKKLMTDPATGAEKVVQLGSPRRLRTIFGMNMRKAYAAGRWQRIQRTKKTFPYLRYLHSEASLRPRPQHVAWHGVIRLVDDEWWDTHYGPNGFGCNCTAVPVNDRIMARRGWSLTERPPQFMPERYVNPRTGELTKIEAGISPGFNYNVGKAYLQDLAARPMKRTGKPAPEEVDGFFRSFGIAPQAAEAGEVFTDRGGWPLVLSRAMFRDAEGKASVPGRADKLRLAAEAIALPQLIRWHFVKAEDGSHQLVRRYEVRVGEEDVVVDIGKGFWSYATSAEADFGRFAKADGPVAWRRGTGPAAYAEQVAAAPAVRQPVFDLGPADELARGRLAQLGIGSRERLVSLDHGRIVHILRRHARDSRGQKAIAAGDIALAREILNQGEIERGTPPVSRDGTAVIFVRASVAGSHYEAAYEVRKDRIVLKSLRKR